MSAFDFYFFSVKQMLDVYNNLPASYFKKPHVWDFCPLFTALYWINPD